ncbi:MAG: hypothetical protein AAF772_06920 [Acidobacteriota bacterium]
MKQQRGDGDEAPVFVRAYDLYTWLQDRLGGEPPSSRAAPALRQACRLLDAVTLAVRGRGIDRRLEEAQEAALLLTVHLRAVAQAGQLSDRQQLHAHDALRDIGRQLTGWQRHRSGRRRS